MFAWAVGVSLVLVLLLIWSSLYQNGLLSRSERDPAAPAHSPESTSKPPAEK